ncbi:MAG: DUF1543 domain-containing protein [Alphaproteobacteria bacterium]|nr:DUF1543 domain-containing protein [Alphaproteobacteria bacterium]MDE2335838.1 DUF1543 domain-containing protein [Alphaproteobacteria bacterium]
MAKIFAIYIGGSAEKSLIELHDVRFVIADTIEETYPRLRESWWGRPESLHIDCWGALNGADGHNIALKTEPPENQLRLYFVNLGGYDPEDFTELHKNVFVVAENESKAKVRALKKILDWKSHHKDYLHDVENVFSLEEIAREKSLYIHLEETADPPPFAFKYGYHPIGKKAA